MKDENFQAFFEIAEEIIAHPMYKTQKDFYHHDETSVFDHAVIVAFESYRAAKKLGLDPTGIVRGALLHDFFLYDWHVEGKIRQSSLFKKHGFTHAAEAHANADFFFELDEKETDIILRHMFPLNIKPPVYLESWLVNIMDNYITFREYFRPLTKTQMDLLDFVKTKIEY